jgi:F-box protein 21
MSRSPTLVRVRIAQENIEIIEDVTLVPRSLFMRAGKFFKRFDPETCRFVSNVREIFPDD